ncbi:Uncharacterised protein [Moraxella equi]|uniref:Uncharacterized protein n=1 Tax=Moraxella equi TaxID=60442 RepID=A0A378QMK5_9GAMM|nr:hypothetical protein [Moraxella equi]STZ02119.1 Uncharacterised protein [Moraxella equi]
MMSMKSANNELDKHYVHFIDIDIAKKSFVLATSLSPKTMITQHKALTKPSVLSKMNKHNAIMAKP